MMNRFKIGITPIAFIQKSSLIEEIEKHNFAEVRLNKTKYPLDGNDLIDFLQDLDGSIIGRERIDENILRNSPTVKVLSKYGVGMDNVDLKVCGEYGVDVVFSQGVNRRSVAEQTLAFMIFLVRNLYNSSLKLKTAAWERIEGRQLTGKNVGIIGVGNVGKEVVELLKPFNCEIRVNDIIDQHDYYTKNGLKETSKENIYENCDIISIHTPLTKMTENMISKKALEIMRPDAFLINTARGAIVNQDDLKWALKSGVIAGAAVDVFEMEPPDDKDFLGLENLICTPHLGGYAREAIMAMGMASIQNLLCFFRLKDEERNQGKKDSEI